MIDAVVPPCVVTEHRLADDPDAGLFPEEEALVSRAVEPRRREFATTRRCAREALARLGAPPGPLLASPRGEPGWPAGTVGSLTHCAGFRGAAVARASDIAALGIDAEPDGPLPDGVLRLVSTEQERRHLDELDDGGVHWPRLLFSAKESVFKAWYPLARRELSFSDVTVTFSPGTGDAGRFAAEVAAPRSPLPDVVPGRWLRRGGLLLTSVALPVQRSPQDLRSGVPEPRS